MVMNIFNLKPTTFAVILTVLSGVSYADPYEDAEVLSKNKDYKEARAILRPLAKLGEVRTQFEISQIPGRTDDEIREKFYWSLKAAKQGHIESQNYVGILFIVGDGVQRDIEKGAYWLKMSAKGGFSKAQYFLGKLYLLGQFNFQTDVKESAKWYQMY